MFKDTPNASGSENNESSSTAIHSKAFSLDKAISQAQSALLDLQDSQGYWVFELEADCTIPSEYIMMMHYLDDIDENLQAKIAVYLRSRQSEDGSYPLYTGGLGEISCSVKVYYALKMAGDDIHAPHKEHTDNTSHF
jgi:squalene-hopene/tetraprenyl-beta-curcumene cyclase